MKTLCVAIALLAGTALANKREDKLVDAVIADSRKLDEAQTALAKYCLGEGKVVGVKATGFLGCVVPRPAAPKPAVTAPPKPTPPGENK